MGSTEKSTSMCSKSIQKGLFSSPTKVVALGSQQNTVAVAVFKSQLKCPILPLAEESNVILENPSEKLLSGKSMPS